MVFWGVRREFQGGLLLWCWKEVPRTSSPKWWCGLSQKSLNKNLHPKKATPNLKCLFGGHSWGPIPGSQKTHRGVLLHSNQYTTQKSNLERHFGTSPPQKKTHRVTFGPFLSGQKFSPQEILNLGFDTSLTLPKKLTWQWKSTIRRCISWGFSNVILVFRGGTFHHPKRVNHHPSSSVHTAPWCHNPRPKIYNTFGVPGGIEI